MKLIMLAMLTGLLFSGCVSRELQIPQVSYLPTYSSVKTTSEHINNFRVGETQTKSVGEPMITQDDVILYPAFMAENEVTFPDSTSWNITSIPANAKLKAVYQYEDGKLFCKPITDSVILFKSTMQSQHPACLIIEPSGVLSGVSPCDSPDNLRIVSEVKEIKFTKTSIFAPGSMRKELLYNGKSKDTIKMTYREFQNDMARPAFFQDLSYDLIESKIIGFKGTQIEIIDATNSEIKYKVIKKNLF